MKTKGIKGLRFVVNSGANNFASCAEMAIYAEKKTTASIVNKETGLQITVNNGTIFINGPESDKVFELYSYMGEKLETNTSLMPGIYLVKVGDTISKVLVK